MNSIKDDTNYNYECIRLINQIFGRGIRHKDDFFAGIFIGN